MNKWFPHLLVLTAVMAMTSSHARADEEQDLITVLRSGAGVVEKCEACRMLRVVGSAKAVPALASLLAGERTGHAARHALEGLPFPEAGAALRQALEGASGLLRAGLIDSLGWRRDTEASRLIAPALGDADSAVATSAAAALGRIGGPPAIAALTVTRETALGILRPAVIDALLRCAEQALAEGRPAEATALGTTLASPSESIQVRIAAHAIRLRAAGDRTLAQVLVGLESGEPAEQLASLQVARSVTGDEAGRAFAELLPKLAPAPQIALLAVLRQRGDPAVVPAVSALATHAEPAVRSAAIAALGSLGDASVVPVLAAAAGSANETEQGVAREALVELNRGPVAQAMVALLAGTDSGAQAEMLRALVARGEKAAVPALLNLARSDVATSRKSALQALGILVDESHVPGLVEFLVSAHDDGARDEARGLFESLADRPGGVTNLDITPIVLALARANPETRAAILQVGARFPDARLRPVFREALKDPDERLRRAAGRALCDTHDVELLPELLALAGTASDETLQVLAVRGVARLATDESVALSPARRAGWLTGVVPLAGKTDEKRLLLSSLAAVPDWGLLDRILALGREPALKADAEAATLKLVTALAATDASRARAVLQPLASDATNPTVRDGAAALLKKLPPAAASPP